MEELWEDITLTILHQERSIIAPRSTTTALQDFLSGPVIAPPPPHVEQVLPLRAPPSPPALSLNTSMTNNTYYDYTPDAHGHNSYVLAGAGPPSPAELTSFCSKKRMPENTANGSDRHFRRMIKNREAAARSRARKQAYTNELELEASHLKQENAKLKKEYEEVRLAMAAKPPKRSTLQRSTTAPF